MAASEAAVTAVMETLGCEEFESAQDGEHYCRKHRHLWLAWGCQDAAIAARAAVDADRASIQAETLREAATDARRVADESEVAYQDYLRPYDQGVADAWDAAADGLRARADRIEAQP